ncbi:MAG TPA: S24 family peptidase, partial [Oscillospiraceae bacterium]|nr:S24 family peptidase [Oscillospiraceae bacterium]
RILVASGMFPAQDNVVPFTRRSMPVYDLPASAGTGAFLDSSDYEMVQVGPEVPVNANFGVRVSGDSMEPEFHDGQIVWVQQQPTLESKDIGIFLFNGQAYIKQWQPSVKGSSASLVSFNSAYQPIVIHETDELRVFGKVLS